jgi:endonuclease YncB( thermonuclease family)
MKAQHVPEYERSKAFGAEGRIWLTFWIKNESVTVHVSLFYDREGKILGRSIVMENINLP